MAEKRFNLNPNLAYILDFVKTIVGILLFVVLFRYFVLQPYLVVGQSMEPNFHNGDYLFVDELSYKLRTPERGEVVIFRHPEEECTKYIDNHPIAKNILEGSCKSYIKRIIGLPNETVEVKNGEVKIYNNQNPGGYTLNESYLESGLETLGNQRTTLNKDEYFVLGDNREPNASSDSREWGPLTPKYLVGKAWLRLYPSTDFGIIKKANY